VSLKKLGRYDLVRVLGKGAMGIVYEGRDPNLDRRVAIKTVKVENLSEEAAAEYETRFRTEARSAARLQHPNIVSVYDSDRDGDSAFLVMEYIHGDDLKYHLDKGVRYSLEQSLKMIRDLLSALDYAHKQGIVHRDIKPANLLIEPGGRLKLTDFGVARIQDSGEATRTQGGMVGTLKYMSAEQVQGQQIDSRSDLFSVGVVLYQLLTDKRPFDGDNDFSIIHQIVGQTPPPPSSFNARLPPAIDAVVTRALAKAPEDRFATARDFASALQSAIRRAEDATVVPPADPLRSKDAAGSGSRGRRSMSRPEASNVPTSVSTVTQEVELVYWKDIKDSTDSQEFEAFLAKFPAGIYADLARRRLRKLSPDPTIASGDSLPGFARDFEATHRRSATSPSSVTTPAPGAAVQPDMPISMNDEPDAAGDSLAPSVPATDFDFTRTLPMAPQLASRPGAETAVAASQPATVAPGAPASAPSSLSSSVAPRFTPSVLPAPTSASKQPALGMFAAVAALAAVGIAAAFIMGRDGAERTAAAPASAPASPRSGMVIGASMVPTVDRAAPSAGASSAAAKPDASVARPVSAGRPANATPHAASAAKPKPALAILQDPPDLPAPPPVHEAAVRPVAAPKPAGPNPAEQCRSKIFLAKEFCLAEQCEKAGARNHPLCVQRRADARLREESKVRN
jgi:eukaryotic-like serine/threonine-protein kinase